MRLLPYAPGLAQTRTRVVETGHQENLQDPHATWIVLVVIQVYFWMADDHELEDESMSMLARIFFCSLKA